MGNCSNDLEFFRQNKEERFSKEIWREEGYIRGVAEKKKGGLIISKLGP